MRAAEGRHCGLPQWLEHDRAWGISAQVYELRSARNWGIGDFADLAAFCAVAGKTGADFVGINPMHALFMAEPTKCSPFSPSSRLFLNPIYIAVDRVPGYEEKFADRHAIEPLRETALVDYAGVAAVKLAALRAIWQAGHGKADAASGKALEAFRERGGEALRRHALFEALSFAMVEAGHGSGWRIGRKSSATPTGPRWRSSPKRTRTRSTSTSGCSSWPRRSSTRRATRR